MLSASRANGVAAAPTAGKAAPRKWQFVNINEPKKIQDKGVISVVRAHAMRSVRQKQRLELKAQHQKQIEAMTPPSQFTDSSVTDEQSAQMNSNGWIVSVQADTDWPMALRETLARLEFINLDHLPSADGTEHAPERDEYVQWSDRGQSYGEDDVEAPKWGMRRATNTGTPKSLVADGVFDPFNAMPTHGCASYSSHALNHFVSVMALNCRPVDQGKSQNPLTKIWLPYALQDETLFLATLTFAEVHLETLSGNYKSQKALRHKGDSIKGINTKLGDHKHALSNETIGAVAMLAAMEAMLGNYKELRIHLNGLQKLVYMRGGLQSLGWGGILYTFISWQNLLSSTMVASAPRHVPTTYCLLVRGSLPHSAPIFSGLGLSTEACRGVATSFQNMRCLTQTINSWNESQITLDMLSFSQTRTDTVHLLLSVAKNKPASEMTNLDYQIELCRLAAIIYIKVALHDNTSLCTNIRNLKSQLMRLIKQGETNGTIGVGARQQPTSATWALFVTGALSLNQEEQEWFAQRLAKGIRASGVETWPEIEHGLRQICWLDKLNTPACRSLWSRIMVIHAEYLAGIGTGVLGMDVDTI